MVEKTASTQVGERGFFAPVVLLLLTLLVVPMAVMATLAGEEAVLSARQAALNRAEKAVQAAFWEWAARADRGDAAVRPPDALLWESRVPWSSGELTVGDGKIPGRVTASHARPL
jgi:hypothetical protein